MDAMSIIRTVIHHLPPLVVIVVGLALIVPRLSREPQGAYWLAVVGLIALGLIHLASPVASQLLVAWMSRSGARATPGVWTAYSLLSSLMNAAALACLVAAIVMRRDRTVSPQDIPPPIAPPVAQ